MRLLWYALLVVVTALSLWQHDLVGLACIAAGALIGSALAVLRHGR